MFKIAYFVLSASTVGLLVYEAPSGALLTSTPERGKVTLSKTDKDPSGRTVRGGPTFIWLGGGYHGGK